MLITYNHIDFIERALQSICSQKTSFSFNCIIADDCSSDGSTNIISEYISNFPKLFSHIKRECNLGKFTGGNGRYNGLHAYSLVKAKYIAVLDGDDYWTDPYKLQKQVDYLEVNPTVSCCSTRFYELYGENISKADFPQNNEIIRFNTKSVLSGKWSPTQSCTLLFNSKYLKPIPEIIKNPSIKAGDWALNVWLSLHGEIHLLPYYTACYRMDSNGVWNKQSTESKIFHILAFYSKIKKYTPKSYHRLINFNFKKVLKEYLSVIILYQNLWKNIKSAANLFRLHLSFLNVMLITDFLIKIFLSNLRIFLGRIKFLPK